ncbi:hypothetical protein [Paraburkholderia sp. J76]|uniref:hypothetical protein n=1 Tax=Paraburkholderia sp. J76 TaxID=2805439 RepID=UPI002ABE9FDA|nr:hypothetical protein [Paraburkholderia sp. J76]
MMSSSSNCASIDLATSFGNRTRFSQFLFRQFHTIGRHPPSSHGLAPVRPSMKRSYQVLISPLNVETGWMIGVSQKPAALILVVDPEYVSVSPEQRLRGILHTSRARVYTDSVQSRREDSTSSTAALLSPESIEFLSRTP